MLQIRIPHYYIRWTGSMFSVLKNDEIFHMEYWMCIIISSLPCKVYKIKEKWPKSKPFHWQKFCYFSRPETPDEFQAVLLHTVVELIMHILCQYSNSPWNNFLLLTLFHSTYSCSLLTIKNKWMILMDRLQIFIRYDSISRNYFAHYEIAFLFPFSKIFKFLPY